jgi:hypothetical protein
MDMHPPTDAKLHSLPHIKVTSNAVWDPSCLDDEFSCDDVVLALDTPFDPTALDLDPCVTDYGEHTGNLQDDINLILAECC